MHLENCILDTPIRYLTFTLRGWIDDEYKHCHKLLFR